MAIVTKEISVTLDQLMLDPNNYRLDEGFEERQFTDDDVIELQDDTKKKLRKSNISELEASIKKNGFLEVDRIVVRKLIDNSPSSDKKKYLVVEGNRRTAAFKSVMDNYWDSDIGSYLSDTPPNLIEKSKDIKVVLVEGDREQIEDYSQRLMGIRHVSGPRQWGGYQSAKLIHDMYDPDGGNDYPVIGELLGMRKNETKQKHEAYLAFKQMQKDEKYGSRANTRLFSLFVEMVSAHSAFKVEWLGWDEKSQCFSNSTNLRRIYKAITKDSDGVAEIKNPTDMRKVSHIIRNEIARSEFERGVLIEDIDVDLDADKRERRIRNFIRFVDGNSGFTEVEESALSDLKEILNSILGE